MSVIEIQGLSKNFGSVKALGNISLIIPKGSIFGYLGPNGAGKTTTMKILMGLTHYHEGSVKVLGEEVSTAGVTMFNDIGYLPDATLPQSTTVLRFLQLTARMKGVANESLKEKVKLLGLSKLTVRKIGKLSKGQKQRVGLANALLSNPKLLVLDEPNSGLDPIARQKILNILKDLKKEGKTIFLSSHIIGEVDKIATDIAIIHKGTIIEQGKRKNIEKRFLRKGRYVVEGDIDIEKVRAINYVESCEQNYDHRYVIHVTDIELAEEKLIIDLVQKAKARIRYFSALEITLEDYFMEKILQNGGTTS
ncbi:MAG: ATP-binding cassette domain-containing protein [Candidatus Hodarchaeales archaeon]